LTPHIAVRDAGNIPERRYQILLENARRFSKGEPLTNVVDKAAWY
jgi:phosphoglycerate dehydrogenase-like enzyme